MTQNKHNTPDEQEMKLKDPEVADGGDGVESIDVEPTEEYDAEAEAQAEAASVSLAEQLEDARAAIEKEKKEYMFLMAEFDNYRKRVVREKGELVKNAAEKVLLGLLPIVDDFERGLEASKTTDSADAIREGMELIYNKIVKYLEANGVKAMETTGTVFDADIHEAIATVPAPADDMKGKVLDTVQKGYTLNDKVLRHAKVVVGE
ncbi:MAG: nucleotide exchange factor GrpE [Muribaculaceae bacterium]|nr:nucleotide exchange factor GrpE [Muribaculaceae bacterium]